MPVAKGSHGLHGFLRPQGPERNPFRAFTYKFIWKSAMEPVFTQAFFMEPMPFFTDNTSEMIKCAPQVQQINQ
jgi:hypothetical protein